MTDIQKEVTLADPAERARRIALVSMRHMAPLEAYRSVLLSRWPRLPHFDPLDGGIAARVLLLLESPAPGSDKNRFVSVDNATGTARNLRRICSAAELSRSELLLWNTVPGILHQPGGHSRKPCAAEIIAGLLELPALLQLLPNLQVVVLAGRIAARATPVVQMKCPSIKILNMPHPSPIYVNTSPRILPIMIEVMTQAKAILENRE